MGQINTYIFTDENETVTKTKLNNLVTNLRAEFNGYIDNDNIKPSAGIAFSKLATSGTLTATKIQIDDSNSYIDEDVSGNMTFTDAVTGTKTLAQLSAGGSSGSSATDTFAYADLISDVYTFEHNLGQKIVNISVYDSSDVKADPQITLVDTNTAELDFTDWGDIGTGWSVVANA